MSGDIIHVQGNQPICCAKEYYENKGKEILLEIEEGPETFKKRTATNQSNSSESSSSSSSDLTPIRNGDSLPSSERDHASPPSSQTSQKNPNDPPKIHFKLRVNCTHNLRELKTILSFLFDVDARRLRVYAKPIHSFQEAELLKDIDAPLDRLITITPQKISTMFVEIIDTPEDLRKGDKFLKIRYYNIDHEFSSEFEIKINEKETIWNLKSKLKEKTNVPEENQVISEWFSDRFYKIFRDDKEKVGHIRENDIIRMDALKDPSLVRN